MIKKLLVMSMVIILSIGLVLSGCGESEETTPSGTTTATTEVTETTTPAADQPQSGGVLIRLSNEGPAGPIGIPAKWRGQSGHLARAAVENLFDYNRLEGELIPALAESWEWANDHSYLTLNLRKGVKFHDGTDFDADAVIWNLGERIATHATGSEVITSYEALDDYTVRIHISSYQNMWIARMAGTIAENSLGAVISPTAAAKGEEYIEYNPVGTGPFKFKEFKRDDYLEFERNDDYWGGKPYLDGVKYVFIADTVTMQMTFESGEGDAITSMKFYELAHDLIPKGYNYDTATGLIFSIVPCSGNPDSPFADPLVRQAVDYAIDKEKICKSVFFDMAEPLYRWAPKGPMRYVEGFEGREYNPDKARELLDDAGYPNGFSTTYYAGTHLSGADAEAVQANLNAVGITTNIDPISPGKWQELETNGWDDGLLLSPTPLNPGYTSFSGSIMRYIVRPNEPNWSSGLYWTSMNRPDELEEMVQKYILIAEDDTDELFATGTAIQDLLFEEALILPLYEQMGGTFTQPWIHDAAFGSTQSGMDWVNAWLSDH